jgi:hypothetical protein
MSRWLRGAIAACLVAIVISGLEPAVSAAPPRQSDTGEFRMIVGEPSSLDPNRGVNYSIYVTSQLFDTLYRLEDDGSVRMLGDGLSFIGLGVQPPNPG